MIYQGKARYPVTEAILHCAAISTGQFDGMKPFQVFMTVNRWHRERGFANGFGYHGLFMPDGTFYQGRPFTQIGAHCVERNRGSLGFLMIERRRIAVPRDKGVTDREWLAHREPLEFYTPAQISAVKAKLAAIPGLTKVSGHNDYANKLCPGFKVRSADWLPLGVQSEN